MPADPTPATGRLARLDALDRRLSRRILVVDGAGVQPVWVSVLRRFSEAGSYGVGWVVLFAVVVTWRDGVLPAVVAAACVLGMLTVNSMVKQRIRRPRPTLNAAGHQPSTYSMPSAHTSMAVVGAAVMTTVVSALWWLWVVVAIALAVSRVMLGMHYLADIVVGALFGLLVALLVAVPLMHAAL